MSHSTYAKNQTKRFGLETRKAARTSMSTITKLSRDDFGDDVDEKVYHIFA